ncbi:MAG: CRISPR-associated helicase Cas3' [Candidatus Methanosuratincola verstraetei]
MNDEGSISSAYDDFCRSRNWFPRRLISEGLKELEMQLGNGKPVLLLLDLPTSYGKTTITVSLAKRAIEGNSFFSRIIHVLPMRSIADQLGKEVVSCLKQENENGEFERKVAIQHLGLQESPYFAKKVVITTLDTFVLNFFKAPVKEFSRVLDERGTHFDFPRAQIYSAFVIFDEFHLFSKLGTGTEDAKAVSKSLTSVLSAIKSLCLAGVPVIVMTATMPSIMKKLLVKKLGEYGITIIEKIYSKGDDQAFEEDRRSRTINFHKIQRDTVPELCERFLREGKKVLCTFNTVRDAVYCFNELKHLDPFLIHGKLPEGIRKKRVDEISSGENMAENTPDLAVATQVVESGVNLSFDVLITASCPADRLMQRSGRVAREKGAHSGEVFIIEESKHASFGPYDQSICKKTLDLVIEKQQINRDIIDEVYRDESIEVDRSLWEVLSWLDNFVLLDSANVDRALEFYKGFTDSFGIVTGFMESKVPSAERREFAVGLSEAEAKRVLKLRKKVVRENEIINLDKDESCLRTLLGAPSLSLELQLQGYEGIALDEFDPEIGYVWLED